MARIVVPEDVDDIPSILLIGDSGTHKTFFAGSCPRPMICDFDKGLRVTRGMPDVESRTFKDSPKGSARKMPERGIYQWGKSYPEFLKYLNGDAGDKIEKNTWDRVTLGLDSLTTFGNSVMNYVLDTDEPKNVQSNLQPNQSQWGYQSRLMETVMDQLTAWPVMLVVTAHIQRDTNPITAATEMLPLTTGKFAGRIGVYFDEVWYTEATGVGESRKYKLITESTGMHKSAKTRYGVPSGTEPKFDAVAPYLFPQGLVIEENGERHVLVKPTPTKGK